MIGPIARDRLFRPAVGHESGQWRRCRSEVLSPALASPACFLVVAAEVDEMRDARGGVERRREEDLRKCGRGGSVSHPLDLAIVAHCVDVDPQNIPDPSRDPEGGRFRTGRDHDRKPRVGVADFLGRHSPQQLAI